ncbi:MAG: biotin transporter BioY, partial [Dehalococcoidia bacterium]|nr:biotin transporter BioY [Dehalococcoidia bacterium]
MGSSVRPLTFMEAVIPHRSVLYRASLVTGFSLLTALLSQISIWVGPVPITGQTLAVLLSGAMLGSRL